MIWFSGVRKLWKYLVLVLKLDNCFISNYRFIYLKGNINYGMVGCRKICTTLMILFAHVEERNRKCLHLNWIGVREIVTSQHGDGQSSNFDPQKGDLGPKLNILLFQSLKFTRDYRITIRWLRDLHSLPVALLAKSSNFPWSSSRVIVFPSSLQIFHLKIRDNIPLDF